MSAVTGATVVAWLLTYAIHSTLLLAGVGIVTTCCRSLGDAQRQWLWRVAIAAGMLTTMASLTLPLPRWLPVVSLLDAAAHSQAAPPSAASLHDPRLAAGRAGLPSPQRQTNQHASGAEQSLPDRWWTREALLACLSIIWASIALCLLMRAAVRIASLRTMPTQPCVDPRLLQLLQHLRRKLGLRGQVALMLTTNTGPMVAGLRQQRLYCPAALLQSLGRDEQAAVLAHELAHFARRDVRWNLAVELVCCLFFFQPLNWLARRRMRLLAEFLADDLAAETLSHGRSLARCLLRLAQAPSAVAAGGRSPAVIGMAAYRSQLGQRVARLLDPASRAAVRPSQRPLVVALAILSIGLISLLAPVASARPAESRAAVSGESSMRSTGWTFWAGWLAIGLGVADAAAGQPPTAERPATAEVTAAPTQQPQPASTAAALPQRVAPAARGLSGQVTGRVISRDHENGQLVIQIVRLDNVWKGSKAEKPAAVVGQTLKVEKVFGKFLDVLLTLKPGDGVRIEVRHVSGDNLVFLGETLQKVELPKPDAQDAAMQPASRGAVDATDAPAGMAGFRGILTGRIVSTDVEKGELVFVMDGVKQVWKQNQAPAPERSKGRQLRVTGISGRFLDVALTLKPGDRVEVEAFHVQGPTLRFPGEWLKKIDDQPSEQ